MFGDMDLASFSTLMSLLLEGAVTTLELFALTIIFSLPLGLLIALGRMSPKVWINEPIKFYILVMRGTPLLLQIIVVYFAPYYLFGWNIDRFVAAVIAFSLNYAAYFAEIYRGGIQSIPAGQYEAAEVLGLTKAQTFIKIVLPQVVKRVLPPISNEIIILIKDTALVMVIGVSELFRVAKTEASRTSSITALFVAGFLYLLMTWVVTKILESLENRLSYYK